MVYFSWNISKVYVFQRSKLYRNIFRVDLIFGAIFVVLNTSYKFFRARILSHDHERTSFFIVEQLFGATSDYHFYSNFVRWILFAPDSQIDIFEKWYIILARRDIIRLYFWRADRSFDYIFGAPHLRKNLNIIQTFIDTITSTILSDVSFFDIVCQSTLMLFSSVNDSNRFYRAIVTRVATRNEYLQIKLSLLLMKNTSVWK